uniref:Uncharacterized protein n=1 Tax=Amphimedon queenslandica TaxID=400682 RepID=A0A1X7SN28_AMPQE
MISGFSTIAAAVVILLCITDQCTAQTTNCSALASNGDCSFYDCLSTKFQCRDNDYPLAYGRKYCLRYASESSCFSTGGQAWVTNVSKCLMQSIVNSPLYNNVNTTCDQLETFTFESHPRCYIENGFCTNILLSDQCQNLVCIGNEVFTDRDLYSKRAIDQITRTAASCSSRISTFLLDARECRLSSPDHALVAAIRDYLGKYTTM